MKLSDIDFSNYDTFIERPKDHCKLYKIGNLYYKIWTETHAAYYIQTGLDNIYNGYKSIASITTGLIDSNTCSTFVDLIHNDTGKCCGYIMHEGTTIHEPTEDYKKFVDYLVDHSLKTGYAYKDLNYYNVVIYRGNYSLIDINFNPIKLNHGRILDSTEMYDWFRSFKNKDGYYLKKLFKELNVPVPEIQHET